MAVNVPEFVPHPDDDRNDSQAAAWPQSTSAIDTHDLMAYHKTGNQAQPNLYLVRALGEVTHYSDADGCPIDDDLAIMRIARLLKF